MLAKGYQHPFRPAGTGWAPGLPPFSVHQCNASDGGNPRPQSDASDASDESDAKPGPSVFSPEPVAPEEDPTLTRMVGELYDTCLTEGCTAGLWAPESRALGYCAKCRKEPEND